MREEARPARRRPSSEAGFFEEVTALEILTNNPALPEILSGIPVRRVEGGALDVLMEVRRRLEDGAELISAPLPPNGRLMRSPWRSLLLRRSTDVVGPALRGGSAPPRGDAFPHRPRWSDAGLGGEALDRAIGRIALTVSLPDLSGGFARLDAEMLLRALEEARR